MTGNLECLYGSLALSNVRPNTPTIMRREGAWLPARPIWPCVSAVIILPPPQLCEGDDWLLERASEPCCIRHYIPNLLSLPPPIVRGTKIWLPEWPWGLRF